MTSRTKHLLLVGAWSLVWGVVFAVSPVFTALFVAVPIFLWRECLRAERHGFWLGAKVRYPMILSVCIAAVFAPTKFEDQKIGQLPRTEVTLDELWAHGITHRAKPEELGTQHVKLPSTQPTRGEVILAIDSQTSFRTRIHHCGTQATLLYGTKSGPIILIADAAK